MKKKLPKPTSKEISFLNDMMPKITEVSFEEAEKLFKKSKKILDTKDLSCDNYLHIRYLAKLAEYKGRRADLDIAEELFVQIKRLGKKHKDAKAVRFADISLANIQSQRGNQYEAIDAWRQLLKREQDINFKLILLNNISVANYVLGKNQDARDTLFQAIEIAENNDLAAHLTLLKMNLGNALDKLGDITKAEQYWREALELAKELGDWQRTTDLMNSLTTVHQSRQEYDKALKCAFESLEIRKKYLNERTSGVVYGNIGGIYSAMGDYDLALKNLEIAKDRMNKENDLLGYDSILLLEAKVYLKMGKPELAIEALDRISQRSEGEISSNIGIELWQSYTEAHNALGNFEKALACQKEICRIQEANLEEHRKNSISIKEAEYYQNKIKKQATEYQLQNIELKAKNKLIRKTSRDLKAKNNDLSSTIETFKWLLATISHDVRAPLTNYSTLLKMMMEVSMPLEEQRDIVKELYSSSQAVLNFINEMLDGIRLQRLRLDIDENIHQTNIIPSIKEVVEIYKVVARQHKINFIADLPEDEIVINTDNDLLKTIIRNLLNNAIKFTPSGGEASISVLNEDNQVQIVIEDSGEGISDEAIKLLMKGKAIKDLNKIEFRETGIGLALVQDALKRMKYKMEVSRKDGGGSRFRISIPK